MNNYTSNNTKGFLAQEIPSPYLSNNTKLTSPDSISDHTDDIKFKVFASKNAPNVYANSLMDVMDVIGKDFFVTLRDYLLIKVPNVNYNTHITSVSLIDIISNAEARAVLLPKYDSGYDIEYFRQLVKYVNYIMSMCNVESVAKSAYANNCRVLRMSQPHRPLNILPLLMLFTVAYLTLQLLNLISLVGSVAFYDKF